MKTHSLFIFLFLWSCSKMEILEVGYQFFPIEKNTYRIYHVHDTLFNAQKKTIESYQLKESVFRTDTLHNQVKYTMIVEKRENENARWKHSETYEILKNNQQIIVHQNNQNIVKMIFPVQMGRVWDAHSLNESLLQNYEYRTLEENEKYRENLDHIKLQISDFPPNKVEDHIQYEIYAEGIGLVKSYLKHIRYCQSCEEELKPEEGKIRTQKLIEYGTI